MAFAACTGYEYVSRQVLTDLRACGYDITQPQDAGEPTALATGGSGLLDLGADPLAVEPVGPDPTTLGIGRHRSRQRPL